MKHSDIVNEQLDQLYMSLEGFSKHLALEDSFPSSSSSGDEKNLVQAAIASTSTASLNKPKKRRRFMAYEKYSMVFEEDAPLPPSLNEMILTHDDTSYCSYTSSFLKTDKSDDSMKGAIEKAWCKMASSDSTPLRTVRKEPSWMENVELTPELLLRYKMNTSGCILNDVLQSDCQTLLKYHQSDIVNEQLDQLYMSLEGFSKHLALEDSFPSSSSSGDEKNLVQAAIATTSTASLNKPKKRRRFMAYEKYSMVFEEDAPLPPSLNEMIARTAQSS
ncbi:hypothetical protein J6590_012121 [Homalodisca vitripennis]|nr:hypothetical protein J6590_012121 [Homalodisca vitripennis]